jgi:hypothetical protein
MPDVFIYRNLFFKFDKMLFKNELQSIISGTGKIAKGDLIQAVSNYSGRSKATDRATEETERIKEQEEGQILKYAGLHKLFIPNIDKEWYLGEGAEQKVYLDEDGEHVIKFNESLFYATWIDYFNSLLLHNFFFPSTSYELIGFNYEAKRLCAVVRQPYVRITEVTNEKSIREFMIRNGFINKKNNDYINKSLGIILEDLHDGNVLTSHNSLFFIDTVFYLTEEFYN